jgi:hypothetical protein
VSATYITFEDVKVPVENLIGNENEGFKYIMVSYVAREAVHGRTPAPSCLCTHCSCAPHGPALMSTSFGMFCVMVHPRLQYNFNHEVSSTAESSCIAGTCRARVPWRGALTRLQLATSSSFVPLSALLFSTCFVCV